MKNIISSIGHLSLQGGREENQDAYITDTLPNGWLLAVVCDGMGGHNGGQMASKLAIEEIQAFCQQNCDNCEPMKLLEQAIGQANFTIFHIAATNTELRGMGTTVTALLLTGDKNAFVAHVGDSRTYQIRNKRLIFKTQDHSQVYNLVLSGQLTEEEARVHENANNLTKALGIKNAVEPTFNKLTWQKDDTFFLCSDGVWGVIDEPSLLARIYNEKDTNLLVTHLLSDLDNQGRQSAEEHDNLTAISVKLGSESLLSTIPTKHLVFMASLVLVLSGILWGVKNDYFSFLFTPKKEIVESTKHEQIINIDSLKDEAVKEYKNNKFRQDSIENSKKPNDRQNIKLPTKPVTTTPLVTKPVYTEPVKDTTKKADTPKPTTRSVEVDTTKTNSKTKPLDTKKPVPIADSLKSKPQ